MSDGKAAAGVLDPRRRLRLVGTGVSIVLVVIAIVLATQGDDGEGETVAAGTSPQLVEADDLVALEDSLAHEIYWAGERPPDQLELTEEADGSIYLRYLPPGTDAGDPRPQFLTVGTYPVVDAVAALRRTASKAGSTFQRAPEGGFVLVNPNAEGSVYLAQPGADLQIEVYDPAPGRALELIRSGAIRPVG